MEKGYEFEKRFREQILKCSRCGFCQAVCPVYKATLRPALNARGKMLILKEVMDGKIDLSEELIESLFQCTICASCYLNCPSGVEVPEIIKAARRDMAKKGILHPAFLGMEKALRDSGNIYMDDEPDIEGGRRVDKAKYVYFVGCVGLYRETEATDTTLELLDRLGVDYTLIDEVCCGGVLEDVGLDMIEDLSKRNMENIFKSGADTVITGCPYCFRTFNEREQYGPLRDRGIRIIHISQFLKDITFDVKTDKIVTYHDPCDLGRHCGIYEEPREIIRKIAPRFTEMEHHHQDALCCGAGGGVRGAFPKNSIEMARRRLKEAEEIGAEVVLTDCNSCLHNLSNAKLRRQKFKIYTTPQLLVELMDQNKI